MNKQDEEDINVLAEWRQEMNLNPEEVDKGLNWPTGQTLFYEQCGLHKIPCHHIALLVAFYKKENEFYKIDRILNKMAISFLKKK